MKTRNEGSETPSCNFCKPSLLSVEIQPPFALRKKYMPELGGYKLYYELL